MQEQLTSDDYGASAIGSWAVLFIALTALLGYASWSAIHVGNYRELIVFGFLYLAGASQIAMRVLGVRRVTVDEDTLRVFRLGEVREIPLARIRGVEYDLMGGAPKARCVLVSVEPEPGKTRELEWIEFVPRGGEFGVGGQPIADDLRARVRAARARASDATIRYPKWGDVYEPRHDVDVSYQTRWRAPVTGGGTTRLRAGDQVVVSEIPREEQPLAVYVDAVDRAVLEARVVPEDERNDPQYAGFHFHVRTEALNRDWRLVREKPQWPRRDDGGREDHEA